ncbi:peptidase S8/S53 domain-containing protein [Protomyces lactucae-debilis]|uniref:Peptidase S8/S53 domain-containing protein n=1 Tax=Protomyces lactucae-debilis TaxID=2754530 RepID=A0A1Y2FF20_PROLT|nr:peptidase S8/S53 domain-containing protein [Protomyces lactucae-debilis]ORY81896.1 peptidase S8/S53 domain-containing protein [Protomyces lactucae-debilis]
MRLYALSLLAVFASGYSAAAHTRPRDYEHRDYYALELAHGANLDDVLRNLGATLEHPFGTLPNHYMVSVGKENGLHLHKRDDRVPYLIPQLPRQRVKRGAVPRQTVDQSAVQLDESKVLVDFITGVQQRQDIHDPILYQQWYLFNRRDAGLDINVTGVWEQGILGKGAVVALIDDGIDMNSEDLAANYYAEGSYDFNDHNPVPVPKLFDDYHGTRCAGEIAAVRNDVCGIGIAYEAKVSGLRILSGVITDGDEAISLNYDMENNWIYSCSWGPTDDGKTMEGPHDLIKRAIVHGVQEGRGGKGSIFVFASGNGAMYGDNCNFDGYTNSIFSITIGGIDRVDRHPSYSELCAAQLAVTYSSGAGSYIHTTDVGGKCATSHGGTSAAAPIGAGIFALVLGERPDLTWRDLQYLCMQTAIPMDLEDTDWEDTPAGYRFNHKYGYGKMDAWAIVETAKTWNLVKPQSWFNTPKIVVETLLGDAEHKEVKSTFEVTQDHLKEANLERVEHVTVTVNIQHQRRGDVTVDLYSPHGIRSSLATMRSRDVADTGFVDWTFMTVKHWGEDGVGNWQLVVGDHEENSQSGKFLDWTMTLWGESRDATKVKKLPIPGEVVQEPVATTSATVEVTSKPTLPKVALPTSTPDMPVPDRPIVEKPEEAPASHNKEPEPMPTTIIQPLPDDIQDEKKPLKWSSKKAVWIYVAAAASVAFVLFVALFWWLYARRTQTVSREDYEFKELRASGGQAGELYDAFAVNDSDDESIQDLDELDPLAGRHL